jgi:hypothetical protein
LKKNRLEDYKNIHKKKIRARNLEIDMKINRLLRDNDLFEEEKHRKKNLKLKKFEVTKI